MSQSVFLIAWIIVYFNVLIADLLCKTLNTLPGEDMCVYEKT